MWLVSNILIIVLAATKSQDQAAVLLPETFSLGQHKVFESCYVVLKWKAHLSCHLNMARILNIPQVLEIIHQKVHSDPVYFCLYLMFFSMVNNNTFFWTLIIAWPKVYFIYSFGSVFDQAFSSFCNSLSLIFSFYSNRSILPYLRQWKKR